MYDDLRGKIALVTGSGRAGGLGFAIAEKLAREGTHVMLHDIGGAGNGASAEDVGSSSELTQAVKILTDQAFIADGVTGDLTKEKDVIRLIDSTISRFGRIDILINNAGVGFKFGSLLDMTVEDWNLVLDVNLRGSFLTMKHAARQMKDQQLQSGWGRGRIISIGSRASKSGSAWAGAYAASKHGLVGLTRSLALELGAQGITVNMVCPNHVTTKLGSWQNDFMANARSQSVEEYLADMRSRIPLGRVGDPTDTANACAFLVSGQASYITGEAMNVSGGEEYH